MDFAICDRVIEGLIELLHFDVRNVNKKNASSRLNASEVHDIVFHFQLVGNFTTLLLDKTGCHYIN